MHKAKPGPLFGDFTDDFLKTYYIEADMDFRDKHCLKGETSLNTNEKMEYAKKEFGITEAVFRRNKMDAIDMRNYIIIANVSRHKKIKTKKIYKSIKDASGLKKNEVKEDIACLNDMEIMKVTPQIYSRYEMYNLRDDEAEKLLENLVAQNAMAREIEENLESVDAGEMSLADVEPKIEALRTFLSDTMTENEIKRNCSKYANYKPEIKADSDAVKQIAVDIRLCELILGCSDVEYIMFRFDEKNLSERREFICTKSRKAYLRKLNPLTYERVTDVKSKSYNTLKDLYGRDAVSIESLDDFEKFRQFAKDKDCFVLKPEMSSQGNGIKKIELPPLYEKANETEFKEFFDGLFESTGPFFAEELINPHPAIDALNRTSVNTVRIVTCYNGKEVKIQRCFMKIGRGGSFVDNGGAGGILVSVNQETGVMDSDGMVESGHVFEVHPDSGIKFKGYRLPHWDSAIELCKEAAKRLPHTTYIGWDVTCNNNNKWLIVEANSGTAFVGQQGPSNKGMRKEFMEMYDWIVKDNENLIPPESFDLY